MIFTQALMVLSLLPWAGALMMSPMAFDSGPSKAANVLIGTLLAYPVLLAVCTVLSWLAFRKGNAVVALICTTLPVVLVVAGGIALQIHG